MTSDRVAPPRRRWIWPAVAVAALAHYVILATFGDPLNFGTLLSLCIALIGFAAVLCQRKGRPFPPWGPRGRRWTFVASSIVGLWYLSMTTWMFVEARSDESQPIDVLVVLGAGLKNGRPTHTLERRIARAADYLTKNPKIPAVVCGGVGLGESRSEAEVMRSELVRRGVGPERIWLEQRSTSTVENLRFAHPVAKARCDCDRPRTIIVTSNFHLARAKMLARNQGFDVYGLPASTPWYVLPNTTARESVAIIKSVLVDLQ